MLRTLKKVGFVIVLISLLLSGCSPRKRLQQPIADRSRIGVIANFRSEALFQRAGTTSVDNSSFYRRVPSLNMNALVTAAVTRDLYRSRRFKVLPIYHRTANFLFSAKVTKGNSLSAEYQDYVSRLVKDKNLDTVVLITPGDIDFGNGQYVGAIWWVSGYGLFNRAFVFMETNTIYAAFNVYIVNAKTFRVLASTSGNLQRRVDGLKVDWRKGFSGVSSRTLQAVKEVLNKRVPAAVVKVVHQTGIV